MYDVASQEISVLCSKCYITHTWCWMPFYIVIFPDCVSGASIYTSWISSSGGRSSAKNLLPWARISGAAVSALPPQDCPQQKVWSRAWNENNRKTGRRQQEKETFQLVALRQSKIVSSFSQTDRRTPQGWPLTIDFQSQYSEWISVSSS